MTADRRAWSLTGFGRSSNTCGSIQGPKQQLSGSSKTFYCLLYSDFYRIRFERRKAPQTAREGTASPPHRCSTFFPDHQTNTAEYKASLF